MSNDECRMDARNQPVRWRQSICHLLFVIFFLTAITLHAEPDKEMSSLLGKLEELFSANSTNIVSTNQASLLTPPLPEIPPTAWERYGWIVWLVLPFVVMFTGIIAALLLRPGKPPVLVSPAAQARTTFAALEARPEDGAMLSQISRTLRRYLVAAFWLNPDETTTAEFCKTLNTNAQVGAELSSAVTQFLRACDERKFSPGQTIPPLDAVRRATRLVEMAEARRFSFGAKQIVVA